MACAGDNAVRVAALAHQAGIVHIILFHHLLCALRCHTLLCAKLDKFVDILLLVRVIERIHNANTRQVKSLSVLRNFFRSTDNDQICDIFLHNLDGRFKGSFVHRFREDDRLLVSSCFCLQFINKCHGRVNSFLYLHCTNHGKFEIH